MTKIERIHLYDASSSVNVAYKLNELADTINKLQDKVEIHEKTQDSLSLQVSQQQEAIDDMQLEIARLKDNEQDNFVCRQKTKVMRKGLDDMLKDKLVEINHVTDTGKMVSKEKVQQEIESIYNTN